MLTKPEPDRTASSPERADALSAHDALCDLQTEWARIVVATLADLGVASVVVSPGSRSTPALLAALAEPRLDVIDVIDERSAAFVALGMAKASLRPVALLCTSGSAGAHYLPALLEAKLSGVPLVVLTADRPLADRNCGALQTVDQVKWYGDAVLGYWELGSPAADLGSLRAARRQVVQAVTRACAIPGGPVHINARFHKPLEPVLAVTADEQCIAARARAVRRVPVTRVAASGAVPSDMIVTIAERIARSRAPLVLCGPNALSAKAALPWLRQLVETAALPVLAETSSQLRDGAALGAWLCADPDAIAGDVARLGVDFILQIGAFPTSARFGELLAERAIERAIVSELEWPDPIGDARFFVRAPLEAALRALAARVGPAAEHHRVFLRRVQRAAADARLAAAHAIAHAPFSEAEAVALLGRELLPGCTLMVGNSLAIRLVDRYAPAFSSPVVTQRGTSGIDGLLSCAAGIARTGRDTALVLGDISLLHDIGGLAQLRDLPAALRVVVLNNHGGRIFEQLPIARTANARVMSHFTTSRPVDFAAVAAGFGVAFTRAQTAASFGGALQAAFASPEATIVEADVGAHVATEIVRRHAAANETRR